MNQNEVILKKLQTGAMLTPLAAEHDPDIRSMRLAARIKDLRDMGHDIEKIPVHLDSGKTVAGYRMRMQFDGAQRLMA